MTRFLSTLKLDATLQSRNKLYLIAAILVALIAVALWQLVPREQMSRSVPVFLLTAPAATTYLFVGGLILFELSENTLNGLIVSPLRPAEYVWSKVVTLSALSTAEGVAIVLLAYVLPYGWDLNLALLVAGMILLGVIYTLLGIAVVVRYRSVNDFLVPSIAVVVGLTLPALRLFGLEEVLPLYLLPTMPPLLLLESGFRALAGWEWAYALGGSAAAIAGLYLWARRAFERHVVMRAS